MSIIDSIQLSGSSYDVRDKSATTVVSLTQQEYDALPSSAKTANILYNITDAAAGDLTQYWTSAQTQSAIIQATSGKVDSSSVVSSVTSASTDSEIPTAKAVWDVASQGGGGGGGVNVVQTTGSSTTDVMSQDAVTTQLNNKANKTAAVGGYGFGSSSDGDYIQYKSVNNSNIGNSIYYPKINGKDILTSNNIYAKNNYNFELVETSAITTSVTSSSTDSEVPSAKCLYDAIGDIETLLSNI